MKIFNEIITTQSEISVTDFIHFRKSNINRLDFMDIYYKKLFNEFIVYIEL